MGRIYDEAAVRIDLSWYPWFLTIEWGADQSFARMPTRAAPSNGKWEVIEFDHALSKRFDPYDPDSAAENPSGANASAKNPKNHDGPTWYICANAPNLGPRAPKPKKHDRPKSSVLRAR